MAKYTVKKIQEKNRMPFLITYTELKALFREKEKKKKEAIAKLERRKRRKKRKMTDQVSLELKKKQ
jgi:hypothetical protein